MNSIARLNKNFALFGLYWQSVLDTILVHIFVIAFLKNGLPIMAAILMSLDSIFKVTFSLLMANWVERIPPYFRGRSSLFIKFSLIFTWFYAVYFLVNDIFSIMACMLFIVFKFFIMFDSYVSAEFIFSLKKRFSFDLTQTVAAQNILSRASIAIAPAVSLAILSNHSISIAILAIAICMLIYSVILLKEVFFIPRKDYIVPKKTISFFDLLENPYMKWGLMHQVLANLAFAGVSFLFLKEIKPEHHIYLNEITMLYSAFFMTQMIIFIFGDRIVPVSNVFQVCLMMGLCGLCVFLSGYFDATMTIKLVLCFLIGCAYSLSLSGVQKTITTKLEGSNYLSYIGWAQPIGRSCSFIATLALGCALSANAGVSSLLMCCGLLGVVAAGLLSLAANKVTPYTKNVYGLL